MAVPKRRISRSKQGMKRASRYKLDLPGMNVCPKCGDIKAPHRVCKSCGSYNDKTVVEVN